MPAGSAQREDATPDGWYWVKDVGCDAGGIQKNSMKARPAVSSAAPDLAAGSHARQGLARGLPARVPAGPPLSRVPAGPPLSRAAERRPSRRSPPGPGWYAGP
jgi:hypothetical protein